MASAPFVPTHTVPATGLRAWSEPDGTGPPAARLDPHLDVAVMERKGDWAHIVCSNGWQAWVDGRRLVERGHTPTQTQPQWGAQSQAELQSRPSGASMTEIRGLSIASLVGAVAIAGGRFLDWWSFGPAGVSA